MHSRIIFVGPCSVVGCPCRNQKSCTFGIGRRVKTGQTLRRKHLEIESASGFYPGYRLLNKRQDRGIIFQVAIGTPETRNQSETCSLEIQFAHISANKGSGWVSNSSAP